MSENNVKIGLVGFGTVGSGVARILLEDNEHLKGKTGMNLELAKVVDLDTTSKRPVDLPEGMLSDDIGEIINDDSISIAVELVGGTTIAKDLQLKLLRAGKDVVTANKALLAEHGNELYAAADEADRTIAFEASCVGGVPVISALRTGLAANRINALYGILNGTCNYILSSMTTRGEGFDEVLEKAQQKGYAEADPTLDINGADTAHKLAILARLAFSKQIEYADIFMEGIENTHIDDIRYGLEMGYVLKLLAIAQQYPDDRISLRVHPCFVPKDSMLGRVDGPFNAVSVFGHAVGETVYYGRGAGMMPTASAVVADIAEVAMGNSRKLFNAQTYTSAKIDSVDNISSRFYIRILAMDKPGVVGAYGRVLGQHDISISGALQKEGPDENNAVPVVITTHPTRTENMRKALAEIASMDIAHDKPVCIPILDMPEDGIED
jgi:homoserine dehydrogenase